MDIEQLKEYRRLQRIPFIKLMNRIENKLEDQPSKSIIKEFGEKLGEAFAAVQEAHHQFVAAASLDLDFVAEIAEDWMVHNERLYKKSVKGMDDYISAQDLAKIPAHETLRLEDDHDRDE